MKKSLLRNLIRSAIVGILLVSVLPNIFPSYWWIDIFSHFKTQYLFISILLLIPSLLLLKKKVSALILIGISILWNSYYIAPYYFNSGDVKSGNNGTFKISSINLLSSNLETLLVKDYIQKEDPDVLVLLEITPGWERNLFTEIENYPYKELVTRTDNFGIAVLSKFEIKSYVDYFDLNDKPSIIGNLTIENETYTLVATHPVPPISKGTFINRNKQLTSIIKKRSSFSDNLIIIGDFNTSSFSNHFQALVQNEMKDSRIGFGLLPTWPADWKILQTTIDHCLVSKNLNVVDRYTGGNIGSDHLPINIVIGLN